LTGPTNQPPRPDDLPDDLAARVLRLEEHAAFAAHESEQLGEQVRALMGKIEALGRRVEGLEARLRRAETTSADTGTDEPE
jgi:phage shock protein A